MTAFVEGEVVQTIMHPLYRLGARERKQREARQLIENASALARIPVNFTDTRHPQGDVRTVVPSVGKPSIWDRIKSAMSDNR